MWEHVLGTNQIPKSVKITRYVSGTLDYGFLYPFDSSLVIVGYYNANQVENVEDRKNTSGACFFVNDCLVA